MSDAESALLRETGGKSTDSYADVVRAHGLRVETRARWAAVGRSDRTQGWKLHLSSIPVQAIRLLAVVTPILAARGVPFKFARNEEILALLNEGSLGSTQIGKFITIYPGSDIQSRSLADELIAATQDFDGPEVLTDLRLGRVVYTRYGGFHPETERDRLGHVFSVMEDAAGRRRDERTVPFVPPNKVANPFADVVERSSAVRSEPDRGRLLGPGYLLLDVIKPDPTGSVFLALDMRDPAHVAPRVLKEGRAHCLSDRFGRDSRTRLKHQMEVHRTLAGRVSVPAADGYFEAGGNGYLALEFVDGMDIGALPARPFCTRSPADRQQLLASLTALARALDALHTAGYVHRDLAPTNVRVRPDGSIVLLDLELAHALGSDAPPFAQGTAGFMSPEQAAGLQPDTTQDMHGFGALMVLLFTGIDPRRILYRHDQGRQEQLETLGGLPDGLAQLVTRCIAKEPARRPGAGEVVEILRAGQQMAAGVPSRSTVSPLPVSRIDATRTRVDACLPKIVRGLLQNAHRDGETGLWLSPQSGVHHSTELDSNYALHRSASRGVAGVIYALARLAKSGHAEADVRDRVEHAVDWLLTHAATPDDQLPGLHFGEAGVALAIAESVHAGLLEPGRWLQDYLVDALAGPLDWPDITHGAAGQGVAAIACGDLLQDDRLVALSRRCAQYLMSAQDADGGWTLPEGVEGMSGGRYLGFAHGVAGEVYFLAAWAERFGDQRALLAAQRGAGWLMTHAETPAAPDGAIAWPMRVGDPETWRWWCHGAPGIALAFLKMFETTGVARYADVAVAALRAHPPDIRHSNLSQCHGLSGLGEIYLEASRVLGQQVWRERAGQIGDVLLELAREDENGGMTWLVEDPYRATADLMIGCAGVAHFLLRLCRADLSAPLLLESRDPRTAR